MSLYPFLNFNGNCSEAMYFYQQCFGGELYFHFLGDTESAPQMPPEMMHLVVSARLVSKHITLFASDLNEEGMFNGNRVSLFFLGSNTAFIKSLFNKLSVNGTVSCPVSDKIRWGEWASLTDRYGIQWTFGYGTSK